MIKLFVLFILSFNAVAQEHNHDYQETFETIAKSIRRNYYENGFTIDSWKLDTMSVEELNNHMDESESHEDALSFEDYSKITDCILRTTCELKVLKSNLNQRGGSALEFQYILLYTKKIMTYQIVKQLVFAE